MTLIVATSVRASNAWSGQVSVGYSETLRQLTRAMPVEEFPMSVTYAADTVRAHNRIAAHVLRELPHVDRVLWWDDDGWPEDAGLVVKMIACDVDLIGAPYTNKRKPVKWVHQFLPEPPAIVNDMLEVRGVGFGFTMTSRACLQRMTDACSAEDWYIDHPLPHRVANIFGLKYDVSPNGDRVLLSEDYAFCKRWRELGGRVMVYAGAGNMMAHTGGYAWTARDMAGGVTGGGT